MHARIILGLVMLIALGACNLGNIPDTPEQIATPTPTILAGRPQVEIISPDSGDEFVVDEQILVSVNATDPVGITRVQLFANNSIVKTISSEAPEGDPELSAVLDYTPRAAGEVELEVVAFRESTPSAPAAISVTVREDQSSVIATPIPDPGIPQIPNDGVCRALTTVNLNFRSSPTTSVDNVITVLPGGTLAPIIARLPDNSWWKLNYNGLLGWVSAQFTNEYGNCFGIPVEAVATATPTASRTPTPTLTPTITLTPTPSNTPEPGQPDLLVTDFVGETDPVILTGETEVTETYSVSVTNAGFGPSGAFEVTLTINDTDVIDLGVVSDLGRGQSILLEGEVTFDAAGDYDLVVDVDPADDVDEVSEVNNRGFLTVEVTNE